MKSSLEPIKTETRKWYKNSSIWLIIGIILLILTVIIPTTILLLKNKFEKSIVLLKYQKLFHFLDNPTHIHYTRVNKNIYTGGYELYQLNILSGRNPTQQYKLLANFLRDSLFNKSNYEQFLPLCPIIFSMSTVDHPENWRGMLFGTKKFPKKNMPYPYVCFLSVMPNDRRHQLGSILLNQFINEIVKYMQPFPFHI
jgi:hypothetical protein